MCVCVYTSVYLVEEDFAYFTPLPLRPVLFSWTGTVFTQPHMHDSVDSTRRQKAKKTGIGGYHVSFFFKEETCKGNLPLGKILFLALNRTEAHSAPSHLTSTIYEEHLGEKQSL